MSLVCVDLDSCPDCGTPTRTTGWTEPAMFRFADYGRAVGIVLIECTARGCPWWIETARLSLPPDRRPA